MIGIKENEMCQLSGTDPVLFLLSVTEKNKTTKKKNSYTQRSLLKASSISLPTLQLDMAQPVFCFTSGMFDIASIACSVTTQIDNATHLD